MIQSNDLANEAKVTPFAYTDPHFAATLSEPTCPPEEMADALAALQQLDNEVAERQRILEERRRARDLIFEEYAPYEILLDTQLEEPKPIIARNGTIIGSEGNLSAVVGEAKSKKSFLCTAIVGDLLRLEGPDRNGYDQRQVKTLWIDTEQSELHVRKLARRLMTLTGWGDPRWVHPMLKLYALREEPPKQRMQILRNLIEAWRPRLIVIDGIADLQHNTNDLEESERIITELMALSSSYKCHILSVLHTNPNSDKARGHVGSALQRKAETVLYVHRAGDCSVVEPQFCRNEPFERFAFRIDNTTLDLGLPTPAELPTADSHGNPVIDLLLECYSGCIERTILTNKLMERLNIGRTAAAMRISRAIDQGLLIAKDKLVQLPEVCSDKPVAELHHPLPQAEPMIRYDEASYDAELYDEEAPF